MGTVEFQDDEFDADITSPQKRFLYSRYEAGSQPPKMVGFLVRHGLVKSEKAATYILIALSIMFFAASFYFFFIYTK